MRKVLYTKITLEKILLVYAIFLLTLPNDIFELTSLYVFSKPSFVDYDYVKYYLSWLYLPLIIAIPLTIRKRKKIFQITSWCLLFLIAHEFLVFFLKNDFIINYNSYELYMTLIVSILIIYIISLNMNKPSDFLYLLKFLIWTVMLTLLLSIALHNTAESGEYANRYSATNLSHNSTASVLFIGVALYLLDSKVKYRYISIITFIIGIVSTGSRAQLINLFLLLVLYFIFNIKKNYVKLELLTIIVFTILSSIIIIIFYDEIQDLFNIERFTDLIINFFKNGFKSFLTDETSGAPRLVGLKIGLNMLNKNWLIGNGFSCFSFQYQWQIYNGTSAFPHFNFLLYWNILGILGIIPFILMAFLMIQMILQKNIYSPLIIILVLNNFINGGIFDSFKALTLDLLIYITLLVLYRERQKNTCNYSIIDSFFTDSTFKIKHKQIIFKI